MGARQQADLTPDEYRVADALYDLQVELWSRISQQAREKAARVCYPLLIVEQLDRLPADLRVNMQGTIRVGVEMPRYLRVPGWPEMYEPPILTGFLTPAEILKTQAECNDFVRAGNHFRVHRDMEHVWKILSASARKSLRDRLELKSSSGDSSPV